MAEARDARRAGAARRPLGARAGAEIAAVARRGLRRASTDLRDADEAAAGRSRLELVRDRRATARTRPVVRDRRDRPRRTSRTSRPPAPRASQSCARSADADDPDSAARLARRPLKPLAGVNHLRPALVAEDDGVLAALEHDLEVAAADRLLRPPAVDDAPLLADERDRLVVDLPRRSVEARLDERRPRLVQSSRGTNSARVSGMRDHGATSTTVQTEPEPVLARTWRRPSLRRRAILRAGGRSSSSCWPSRLGELDELEPELEHRRRQLGELRRERAPDPVARRRSGRAA